MFLRPLRIKPAEDVLSAADGGSARVGMVLETCRAEEPEVQKRLITALYEGQHLTEAEALELIRRLNLKEA